MVFCVCFNSFTKRLFHLVFACCFFVDDWMESILVNNVGRMYDYPDELGKLSPDFLWSLLNINMGSVTMMTRMLVNDMKKRGKGAIVNISSGSELQPLPYAAVYGASKVDVTCLIRDMLCWSFYSVVWLLQSFNICFCLLFVGLFLVLLLTAIECGN